MGKKQDSKKEVKTMSKAIFMPDGSEGKFLRRRNRVSFQERIRMLAFRRDRESLNELGRIFSNLRRLRMKG